MWKMTLSEVIQYYENLINYMKQRSFTLEQAIFQVNRWAKFEKEDVARASRGHWWIFSKITFDGEWFLLTSNHRPVKFQEKQDFQMFLYKTYFIVFFAILKGNKYVMIILIFFCVCKNHVTHIHCVYVIKYLDYIIFVHL